MEYLTVKQLSQLLGLSIRRVQAKIKQGHFPHVIVCQCGSKSWLVPKSDVKPKESK